MREASRPRRLLLVEDDHDLRSVLAGLLEDAGFEVVQAEDGEAALDKLRAGDAPDAIILDLMMPRMSGWEFRTRQRNDPALAQTPVVVLSANTGAEARAMDADLYFEKPFEMRQLLEGLSRVLSLRDKKKSAERLAHDDRMASLSTLAAGLAHEINSPLTGLVASIDLAERVSRSPTIPTATAAMLERHLRIAKDAAAHIQALVKSVSAFARQSEPSETLDVRPLLEAATSMISSQLEEHALVETDHAPVPPVRGGRSQLLQIFLNLLTNATHAVSESRLGLVRTRTYTSDAGEAVVEISDSGCGIAPDHLARVFDPFFTTKPPGKGTGLGLSLCHALVTGMSGRIELESQLGRGSTFRVVLPAAASAVRPKVEASAIAPDKPRPRVLVVDDEPLVCSVLEHVLVDYDVVVTRDGRGALEAVRGEQRFEAVLCDLNLPDMSGLDVFEQMSASHPELASRFLIMTGGARNAMQARALRESGVAVLEKPFELMSLLRLIERTVSPENADRAAGERA